MTPSSGGPAQGIRNSVPTLQSLGCENEVVCLDDPAADFLGKDTFPVHAIGNGRGPWAYHAGLVSWLRENIARFDAVILHGLWLFPSYAVRKVLGERGTVKRIPYFVFPHGMLDPWFQKAPERRMKALRNWFHWKLVEHKVVRDGGGLLFTCEEELRLARTTFRPYQPKREINVGYGVVKPPASDPSMKAAFEAKCPGLDGRKYLLFLSRIHPKKGVDLLVKAYAEVARSSAGRTLPALVIAGPGLDDDYGRSLQKLAGDTCPPQFVFWAGMLTGDAKWGAFHGCEALVLPSHQENFGIAVVEALACEKPVLISNQINIWREIEQAGAGLVAPDDLAGATKLLRDFLALPESEYRNMCMHALACYQKNFSIALAAQNLMSSIRS